MKTLLTLIALLYALTTHAAPVACKVSAQDGYMVIDWCNLDPGVEYLIEWNEDPTFLLHPSVVEFLTGETSIEMTERQLFVRLTELPL